MTPYVVIVYLPKQIWTNTLALELFVTLSHPNSIPNSEADVHYRTPRYLGKLHLNPHGPIRGQEAPQNTAIQLSWFYTASFYSYFKLTSFWMWEHVCPSTVESIILIGLESTLEWWTSIISRTISKLLNLPCFKFLRNSKHKIIENIKYFKITLPNLLDTTSWQTWTLNNWLGNN